MNGQRVTNMVSAIHRSLGTYMDLPESFLSLNSASDSLNSVSDSMNSVSDSSIYEPFNTLNYSDDFSDVEPTFERAQLSFSLMGWLLEELGLSEATDKAVSPCQVLNFLGIEFDTRVLEMRVDLAKCCELKVILKKWINKTVASKADLQSILGKLLWVSKSVKYSHCFVMKISVEVIRKKFQNKKINLSVDVREHFLWWDNFMQCFNGYSGFRTNIWRRLPYGLWGLEPQFKRIFQ